MVALWAPEFSFASKSGMKIEQFGTDFTLDLSPLFTVVEVKEFCRSATVRASGIFRNFSFRFFRVDGFKRFILLF
jgi:hypothetical protein